MIRLNCLILTAALLVGCGGGGGSGRLEPQDFNRATEDPATAQAAAERLAQVSQERAAPAAQEKAEQSAGPGPTQAVLASRAPAVAPVETAAGDPQPLIVDAMVGQIRGKPVYADEVFRDIGTEELARLGQVHPREQFRKRAQDLIDKKLAEWLYNRLELTEAERTLTERERQGLPGMRKMQREQLIARWGGGVPALANQATRQRYGYSVEELVEQYIQANIIRYYREKTIKPKLDVHRSEVERYYRDHIEEFNPPPSVTVRVIVVRDATAADRVDEALAGGTPFAEVASQYSVFRKEDGGLLPPFPLKGSVSQFNELGWTELNEKVRTLEAGGHSDRTKIGDNFGWVMLEEVKQGEQKRLEDVFVQLERMLRNEKEKKLHRALMSELLSNGNYTPPQQMADALLRVAMVRYAKP